MPIEVAPGLPRLIMGFYIGWIFIGLLGLLALIEILRYRLANHQDGEFPYPRKRLLRRLATTTILATVLIGSLYFPEPSHPFIQLIIFCMIGLGMVIGLKLLWRDLRETSTDALRESTKLQTEASQSIERLFHECDKCEETNDKA